MPLYPSNHFRPCPKPERTPPKPKKAIPKVSKKRKANHGSGEYDVFMEIAHERPHVCYVTRRAVNVWVMRENEDGIWERHVNVNVMGHVVPKGAREDLRKLPENIQIMEEWVHGVYDTGSYYDVATGITYTVKDAEKYEGWHKLLALHDKIIEDNNRDNKWKS